MGSYASRHRHSLAIVFCCYVTNSYSFGTSTNRIRKWLISFKAIFLYPKIEFQIQKSVISAYHLFKKKSVFMCTCITLETLKMYSHAAYRPKKAFMNSAVEKTCLNATRKSLIMVSMNGKYMELKVIIRTKSVTS